jgi:bifunctional non-homologous end joining protein LigD
VRFSEHTEAEGLRAFAAAKERRLEGIMAKDGRSSYEPGRRTQTWLKVKIRPEQELVVGGWTTGIGSATDLAALLVGVYDKGELRYAGKIGTGFTGDKRAELLALLPALASDEQPFASPPPRSAARNAHWVRPELVIRAEFASWTTDGLVRQAAYKGLDRGKDPKAVHREVAR